MPRKKQKSTIPKPPPVETESNQFAELPPIDVENNQPAELGPCSRSVYLASNWIVSIDAWDLDDPELLGIMLKNHPVPVELRPVISDIVLGIRKPNKRAAAKLKCPAGHRLILAGIYRMLKHDVTDSTLKRKTLHDYHSTAAEKGIEVIDLKKQYLEAARNLKSEWASEMGLGTEALDNLCAALESKIKNYPNI